MIWDIVGGHISRQVVEDGHDMGRVGGHNRGQDEGHIAHDVGQVWGHMWGQDVGEDGHEVGRSWGT